MTPSVDLLSRPWTRWSWWSRGAAGKGVTCPPAPKTPALREPLSPEGAAGSQRTRGGGPPKLVALQSQARAWGNDALPPCPRDGAEVGLARPWSSRSQNSSARHVYMCLNSHCGYSSASQEGPQLPVNQWVSTDTWIVMSVRAQYSSCRGENCSSILLRALGVC